MLGGSVGVVQRDQRLVECPDPFGRDQERLAGFQAGVGELGELIPQAALNLVVAVLVPPVLDQGFESGVDAGTLAAAFERPVESVVDTGKLAAALEPPVGPAAVAWY